MRILKSYGNLGGVLVSTASIPEDFEISEPVFIDFDELPVPFFIEEFKPHGSTKAFVKFEDVDSLQDAEELVGREIYFSPDEGDGDGEGFAGLQVFDAKTSREIGTVTEYVDIPSNPCLEVQLPSGQTTLIPCHDNLIDRIDEKKGRLYLIIPEGLL